MPFSSASFEGRRRFSMAVTADRVAPMAPARRSKQVERSQLHTCSHRGPTSCRGWYTVAAERVLRYYNDLAASGDHRLSSSRTAMTPERWKRVKDILGAAWERHGDERDAFLQEACSDDTE